MYPLTTKCTFDIIDKPKTTRADILRLQAALEESPDSIGREDARDSLNTHYFAHGVYSRVMSMPKGRWIIGAVPKFDHRCFGVKGSV